MGGVRVAVPEVGDADPVRPAGLHARLHGGARVVHVHMDVPQSVAADDDEGVPEGVEPFPQPRDGRVRGFQEVDHLEGRPTEPVSVVTVGVVTVGVVTVDAVRGDAVHRAVGRGALGHGGRRAVRRARGRLRGPARERLHEGREDGHQSVSAGVDHTGPLQGGQLLRRRGERRAGALMGRAGHLGAVALRRVGRVGGGRGDGQDGALDGVGHGLPGGFGRVPQSQPQARAVGVIAVIPVITGIGVTGVSRLAAGRQHLGQAAQQLREDRAGVAPGPDQRAVRHGTDGLGQRGPLTPPHRPARLRTRGLPVRTACAANTASTAATADSTVRYRLVPVSPSATG